VNAGAGSAAVAEICVDVRAVSALEYADRIVREMERHGDPPIEVGKVAALVGPMHIFDLTLFGRLSDGRTISEGEWRRLFALAKEEIPIDRGRDAAVSYLTTAVVDWILMHPREMRWRDLRDQLKKDAGLPRWWGTTCI
jgi:hypothetical protein